MRSLLCSVTFFFFNDTATTEIYTLSLHDALPISDAVVEIIAVGIQTSVLNDRPRKSSGMMPTTVNGRSLRVIARPTRPDRKSTRLNSSHANISYAVFCLKKKKLLTHIPTVAQL